MPRIQRAGLSPQGGSPGKPLTRSSPAMHICMLASWILMMVLVNPELIALFRNISGSLGTMTVAAYVICLNAFWLYSSYYIMLFIFARIDYWLPSPEPSPHPGTPEVAVLYTTMNDFQEHAAASCIEQDYPHSHLYILDDSTDAAYRKRIERFARAHGDEVTVIRRDNRKGFKAGSLNYTLSRHVTDCDYFVVADADSVLPPDFVSDLLPYFTLDENIGWVQGSHQPSRQQKSTFARELSLSILPLWNTYYPPRNRFGFVIFLGHGGMIRYDVWEETGGFPELVSEDLAFSTRAGQLGYRGHYARDVVSYEDFPGGYHQLRRQQEKYIKGACEYFDLEARDFLASPAVAWHEKLDIVMSCGSLLIPVAVLFFILCYCGLMTFVFGGWQDMSVEIAGTSVGAIPVMALDERFTNLWTWDFYALMALGIFSPALPSLALIPRHGLRAIKMLLLSPLPYLSLMGLALAAMVSYLITRRAVFLVTGDSKGASPTAEPAGFSSRKSFAQRMGSEDTTTHVMELVLGGMLTTVCVITLNLTLLPHALAMLAAPLLSRVPWDVPFLRPVLYSPLPLLCFGMTLPAVHLLGGYGFFMCVFFFHF